MNVRIKFIIISATPKLEELNKSFCCKAKQTALQQIDCAHTHHRTSIGCGTEELYVLLR